MLVEVEIEEDTVEVPGGSPVLGLCGLCSNCELTLTVAGVDALARQRLLRLFSIRCPEGQGNRYHEANMDDRRPDAPKDD